MPTTYTVTEGVDATAQLMVVLSRESGVPVTVEFETKSGTASGINIKYLTQYNMCAINHNWLSLEMQLCFLQYLQTSPALHLL